MLYQWYIQRLYISGISNLQNSSPKLCSYHMYQHSFFCKCINKNCKPHKTYHTYLIFYCLILLGPVKSTVLHFRLDNIYLCEDIGRRSSVVSGAHEENDDS